MVVDRGSTGSTDSTGAGFYLPRVDRFLGRMAKVSEPGDPFHVGTHRPPASRARAAASVAAKMLGYVPHRHRWPLIAAFTSSRVQAGFRSTSAAQLMTI